MRRQHMQWRRWLAPAKRAKTVVKRIERVAKQKATRFRFFMERYRLGEPT
jgi:hypothetical protein